MKRVILFSAVWLSFILLGAAPVSSQVDVIEGYTFLRGPTGLQVCLGRWVPPSTVGYQGVCEGQLVDVDQLTALSTKMTADRLNQLIYTLESIDEKMAANNEQINRLVEATVKTQASIDQQVGQINRLLRDTITRRFESLPREILSDYFFREELRKLRDDILKDVDKYYSRKPAAE